MPIYRYVVIEDDGSDGEMFEVEQSTNSESLKFHPENHKRVRRIYESPNIGIKYTAGREKNLSDISKIKKAGFEILEKDKISGKYFKK